MKPGKPLEEAVTSNALQAHVSDCESCRKAELPLERLSSVLSSSTPSINPEAWSLRVLVRSRSILQERRAQSIRRRLPLALGISLVALPLVITYDFFLLERLYTVVSGLPLVLTFYLCASAATVLLLVGGAAYAGLALVLTGVGETLSARMREVQV